MITLQQGTIYMGTAAPASGGGSGGNAVWGSITGTLSDQTDLQTALNAKQDTLTAGSNITISGSTISATDTTYSNFVGTDGNDDGTAGLVPAPTTADVDTYLKSDGTWGAVSGLRNNTSVTNSLAILGSVYTSATNSLSILGVVGVGAHDSIAIGSGSEVAGFYANSIALGCNAKSGAIGSIQIGPGINSTSNTLSVGFANNNYKLLDGATGKIPTDRIDGQTTTEVTLATVATSGDYTDLSNKPTVDQTYDGTSSNAQSGVAIAGVLGNIETLLHNLNSGS